jgi:hypothetical protein
MDLGYSLEVFRKATQILACGQGKLHDRLVDLADSIPLGGLDRFLPGELHPDYTAVLEAMTREKTTRESVAAMDDRQAGAIAEKIVSLFERITGADAVQEHRLDTRQRPETASN